MKLMNAPLVYVGGKKQLMNNGLLDYFPENINNLYDVFGGGSSVSLNVNCNISHYNDYCFEVYFIIKNIYSNNDYLIEKMERLISTNKIFWKTDYNTVKEVKASYYKERERVNKLSHLEKIVQSYYLSFFAFSKKFYFRNHKFAAAAGNTLNYRKPTSQIFNIKEFLSPYKNKINYFYNLDYIDFVNLKMKDIKKNDFFYFDPPYLNTDAHYVKNWTLNNDYELISLLIKLDKKGVKWAISGTFMGSNGKKNIHWLNLAKKFNYEMFNISYSANGFLKESKNQEFLIYNYDDIKTQQLKLF